MVFLLKFSYFPCGIFTKKSWDRGLLTPRTLIKVIPEINGESDCFGSSAFKQVCYNEVDRGALGLFCSFSSLLFPPHTFLFSIAKLPL